MFNSDWTSPPANTIKARMERDNMSVEQFANAMGITVDDAKLILDNKVKIDESLAEKLSSVFGVSFEFWLNRQAMHDMDVDRLSENDEITIDEINNLTPTAAGSGVLSEGGSEPVFIDYLEPVVIPESGFDTIGVSNVIIDREDDLTVINEKDVLIDNNTIIAEPEIPTDNTPVDPDEPETPNEPDVPVEPDTPVDPDEPDMPNNPDTPDNPDEPDVPVDPDEPETPNDKPKGNNGVGNGEDGQPPGNPPVNDGPGTGPGNPGNQGGFGGNPRSQIETMDSILNIDAGC